VTINPNVDLAASTGYYIVLAAGVIIDAWGNGYAGISSTTGLNFTTAADTTAPLLSGSSPSDNATDVAAGSNITLTFNEAVKAGTGNIEIRKSSDGSLFKSIAVGDTTQVTFSGSTATINPNVDLAAFTSYYIALAAGVITDTAGNGHAGISSTTALNFTTAFVDTMAPLLSAVSPFDNATGVAVDRNITLTFNEAVRVGTGNIEIRKSSDGSLFKSIAVGDATQVTFSGSTVTINPNVDLAASTGYYIVLAAGVIIDAWGNGYAGISSTTALNFDTAAAPVAGSVSISDVSVIEGNSGAKQAVFTVTRAGGTAAFSVNYATADLTAIAAGTAATGGADYVAAPFGTLQFAEGVSSQTISVTVNGDTRFEPLETFQVNLSSPSNGATLGDASGVGTIQNDDATLTVRAVAADMAEGQGGATPFVFSVTRAGDLSVTHSVDWAVSGPAVGGMDFVGGVLPTGTVSFAAGESSKEFVVNVAGDTLVEGNERFTVSLLNPGLGATIARPSVNATIRNDDASNGNNPLTGTPGQDYIDGLSGNDSIFGLAGTDLLLGRDGNDILDGGVGDDVMIGGAGNDRYYVDQAGDYVVEVDALHGNDTVFASITYTLSQHVENLTLLGTAAIDAFGNDGNNLLTGNNGANLLSGGAGDDVLEGAGGDDTLDGGEGTDTASYAGALAGVTVDLAGAGPQNSGGAGSDTLIGIENLTGSAFADTLLGDSLANVLSGGSGNDQLTGDAGDDILDGGLGNDVLNGGAGADIFAFSAPLLAGNVDTVTGFDAGLDLFRLQNSVFTAFSTAWAVDDSAFETGVAATTAETRLIFNTENGALLYDADGTGSLAAVQFATLTGVVGEVTAGHFLLA
jgi:Ca2+-binding RTX toxin-like protein